ncbi:MAG: aromatic ring-hydroxylating dioxygenase subunit alpha [Pseudomonadota bacterium]
MTDVTAMLVPFWKASNPKRGLPAGAYVDPEFWEIERKSVFTRNWVCIGFAHDVQKRGEAMPVDFAGHQLLIVRNRQGALNVFHNVCRHRCIQLVNEHRVVGNLIRCPYHAWAYDLDGNLRAAPHFGGANLHIADGMDRSKTGLVEVRSHVWNDWIFVNMDGKAPGFDDYAMSMWNRLDGIDWGAVKNIATLDFGEIACNWKFVMENFIEPYHVQFVHKTTTDQPLEDHYTIIDGNCMGSAVDLDEEAGTSGSLAVSSRYLTLYPNFILGRYFPDQIGVYLNIPTGPGTMLQKRALYTTEGQDLSADEIEGLKKLWCDVHKEDHEMTERMQIGRASIIADKGGLLSPIWEDSVRAFQEMVARDVTGTAEPDKDAVHD